MTVLYIYIEEGPGPCPILHYCLLIVFPLFLQSFTLLFSNYLNLPFGTQRRSRSSTHFFFKQATGKASVPRSAPSGSTWFC